MIYMSLEFKKKKKTAESQGLITFKRTTEYWSAMREYLSRLRRLSTVENAQDLLVMKPDIFFVVKNARFSMDKTIMETQNLLLESLVDSVDIVGKSQLILCIFVVILIPLGVWFWLRPVIIKLDRENEEILCMLLHIPTHVINLLHNRLEAQNMVNEVLFINFFLKYIFSDNNIMNDFSILIYVCSGREA